MITYRIKGSQIFFKNLDQIPFEFIDHLLQEADFQSPESFKDIEVFWEKFKKDYSDNQVETLTQNSHE